MRDEIYRNQCDRKRFAWFDDQLILLDIDKDKYAILSPEQSCAYARSAGDGQLNGRTDTGHGRLHWGVSSDCWALKRANVSFGGLLMLGRALRILHLVHRCSRKERLAGLERLVWRQRFHRRMSGARNIERLVGSLNGACMLYARKTKCLEWSVALVVLGFEYGFDLSLVIGVQNRPFYAHAWVEFGGEIVGDDPRLRGALAEIYRVTRGWSYVICRTSAIFVGGEN